MSLIEKNENKNGAVHKVCHAPGGGVRDVWQFVTEGARGSSDAWRDVPKTIKSKSSVNIVIRHCTSFWILFLNISFIIEIVD